MIKKIVKWFNRTFRGWKYTTLGEVEDEAKYWNKKKLIMNIVDIAGKLNDKPSVVSKAFECELRETGKKKLLKAFLLLKLAYSKKLKGMKNA